MDSYVKNYFVQKNIDTMQCERCGTRNAIFDIHHIVYKSEVPFHEKKHDPINLTLTCRKCHDWYHAKKNNRKKIVIERGLEEVFGKKLYDRD